MMDAAAAAPSEADLLLAPSREEQHAERNARRGQRAIYHSYYALAFLVGTFVGLKHVTPETTVATADATPIESPPLAAAPAMGDVGALVSEPWAANGSWESNGSWTSSFAEAAGNDSTAQSLRSGPNASQTVEEAAVATGGDRGDEESQS